MRSAYVGSLAALILGCLAAIPAQAGMPFGFLRCLAEVPQGQVLLRRMANWMGHTEITPSVIQDIYTGLQRGPDFYEVSVELDALSHITFIRLRDNGRLMNRQFPSVRLTGTSSVHRAQMAVRITRSQAAHFYATLTPDEILAVSRYMQRYEQAHLIGVDTQLDELLKTLIETPPYRASENFLVHP